MPPHIVDWVHQLADSDNQNPALYFFDWNGILIADANYDIYPDILPDDPMEDSIHD